MSEVPTDSSETPKESSPREFYKTRQGKRIYRRSPRKIEMATQPADPRELLYKVLVIGELGTGKTSIIRRYVHKIFSEHYRATIGVDFALKVIQWDENTVVRLQLWDIAGQERFGNMTRVYYKEAVGAFIVFDATRGATFEAVLKWKNDLDAKVHLADGSPIPCVLLANKCDLNKGDGINQAKMKHFCETNNFHSFYLTSAKTNTNIDEAARELVNEVLRRQQIVERRAAIIAAENTITLNDLNSRMYGEKVNRFGCC